MTCCASVRLGLGEHVRRCSGMSEHYVVTLTESERAALEQQLTAGRGPARELSHAWILL